MNVIILMIAYANFVQKIVFNQRILNLLQYWNIF